MKKIINPWRNHEGYNCFGCSPDNPIGQPPVGKRKQYDKQGEEMKYGRME